MLKRCKIRGDANSQRGQRKLVIFTEHRDTLNYLLERLSTLIGRAEAIVTIHGGIRREDRRDVEDRFRNDPDTLILLATDAAGEGINLQRAHLMVNYDLPWNPNRLEQRFGRIHRIGQTESATCGISRWRNREGAVYQRLLKKLEAEGMHWMGKSSMYWGSYFKRHRCGNCWSMPALRRRRLSALDWSKP